MIRHIHIVGAGRYFNTTEMDCETTKRDCIGGLSGRTIVSADPEFPPERWCRAEHTQALVLYENAQPDDEHMVRQFLRSTCDGVTSHDRPSEDEISRLASGLIAHRPCALMTSNPTARAQPTDAEHRLLGWIAQSFLERDQLERNSFLSTWLLLPQHSFQIYDPATADINQSIEHGTQVRFRLLRHLQTMAKPYVKTGGWCTGGTIGELDEILPVALAQSELMLWRVDLFEAAWEAGEAYENSLVASELIPGCTQFWFTTGANTGLLDEAGHATHVLVGFLLIPFRAHMPDVKMTKQALSVVEFAVPIPDQHPIELEITPRIRAVGLLVDGMPVRGMSASILACLGFISSEVAEAQKIKQSRQQRRQAERKGMRLPEPRVVALRRRERKPGEDSHLSERDFQCQWIVRAHVRRPNARMKEQRPIWVKAYIKGPEDKPLKAQSDRVFNVAR